MKFFVFLLSFYLLALSCYPCGDRQECIRKEEQKISTAAQHAQLPVEEACTPFCNCSCCTASAFAHPFPFIDVLKPVFQFQEYPDYTVSFYSEDSFSIWQPPKLG